MDTSTPAAPQPHNALTIERALKADGSEAYTIELGSTNAAVLTGAAALANLDPSTWLLRVIGESIADAASRARERIDLDANRAPETVN